jgi:hypothetical protein
MSTTLRRRKAVASVVLGAWLFALFVAFAHACGLDGSAATFPDHAATLVGKGHDEGTPACCERPCSDDIPLLTKLQAVQDPLADTPLVPTLRCDTRVLAGAAAAAAPHFVAHPPPDVSIFLRFLRLAL